jgi:SNF2 family DNA or RNA helicase
MAEYKLILNGEPITRDLLDIWAQFQFLDPEILNMPLSEFKNTFCKYTTITKRFGSWKEYSKTFITGYENIDYLYSLIGEYVFECDLELNVQQVFETAKYYLSEAEKEQYNFLKEKYLDDEKLMMMNNNIFLEMTQKMQHEYSCSESKFQKVADWITDESKTIIFTKYIVSAEECRKRFPKATVLNYQTGSLSLNLQDKPYTVYFDQTFDWGLVAQSAHRNYRTGQENDCRYLRLIGDVGLEELIYKNNQKKLGISEYLKKISKEQLKEVL